MSKPFRPGEPVSAKKLNSHSAALAQDGLAGAPGSSTRFGSTTSMVVHDLVNTGIVARMTKESPITENYNDNGTRTVYKYSWESIYLNEWSENWDRDTSRFGHYDQMPVYSITFGKLEVTEDDAFKRSVQNDQRKRIYPYLIMKDPVSQRLFAVETGGSFTAKSNDLTVLLLGDYDTYKDCPELACMPLPPHTGTGANITLCQPAYAWAAYKVCGYDYVKQFDIRGFNKWALELNGGTGTVNRMHMPKWGWDDPLSTALPSGNTTCAGVKFLGAGAGALSCGCPTWLSEVTCFKITIKYLAEADVDCIPGGSGCGCDSAEWECFTDKMSSLWGTQEDVVLCSVGGCTFQGDNTGALFNFTLSHGMIPQVDEYGNCFYGPSKIEPCNLCDGFARVLLGVSAGSTCGGGQGGAYSHFWLDQGTIRSLVEDCTKGPIRMNFAGYQGEIEPGNACPNVIEWIEISCCSPEQTDNCTGA